MFFFISALEVSGYQTARWRCQKWIPWGKINLVHCLLLWVVFLPKDLLLIRSLYKVNVKCLKKIITESVFCIANARSKIWNVCENLILIFEDASVRVYEDDPYSRTSAPTVYSYINRFAFKTFPICRRVKIAFFIMALWLHFTSREKINVYFSGATFQACLHENNILKFLLHWTLCKFMGLFSDFRGLFWAFRGLNRPEPPCIFFTVHKIFTKFVSVGLVYYIKIWEIYNSLPEMIAKPAFDIYPERQFTLSFAWTSPSW